MESPLSKNFTLNKILGGDILTSSTIRRQIWSLQRAVAIISQQFEHVALSASFCHLART
jgi:hypothetical protein